MLWYSTRIKSRCTGSAGSDMETCVRNARWLFLFIPALAMTASASCGGGNEASSGSGPSAESGAGSGSGTASGPGSGGGEGGSCPVGSSCQGSMKHTGEGTYYDAD